LKKVIVLTAYSRNRKLSNIFWELPSKMRKTECLNNFSNHFLAFELTRPQGSRETVLPALDFFLAGLLDSIGMFILSEERWFDSF